MSRRSTLNPEPITSQDDIIPRCMSGGYPLEWCSLATNLKDLHDSDNSFFRERVVDAMIRLNNGEEKEVIRKLHGGIVLRQAIMLSKNGK